MDKRSRSALDRSPSKGKGGLMSTSFYRIIMPSVLGEHRLVLPKNFVRKYGDELSSTTELDLPPGGGGSKWYIGLKKIGDLVYLYHGWEKFMNHYSIGCKWFLMFKYKGNSVFDVHIFDLKGTEIQYHHPVGRDRNLKGGDAVCKEEFEDEENVEKERAFNAVCKEEFDDEEVGERERERVIDAAGEMDKNKTVNPSFSVKLRANNVQCRYSLHIPCEFDRKHLSGCPEFIKIVDSDNKVWRVRCTNNGGRRRSLGKGWYDFVKEKELKIGDVCVFELVKKNKILKVDVFYAKERNNNK